MARITSVAVQGVPVEGDSFAGETLQAMIAQGLHNVSDALRLVSSEHIAQALSSRAGTALSHIETTQADIRASSTGAGQTQNPKEPKV